MSQSRGAYSPLPDESLESSGDIYPRLLSTRAWLMHGILFIFALILLTSSLVIVFSPKICAEMAWSPVVDAVEIASTRYNVTFRVPSKYPSRFIWSPGVGAVDAEWEQFTKNPLLDGRQGTLAVDHAIVKNLPLASDSEWLNSIVQILQGGEIKYMATLEMFHHIHCLITSIWTIEQVTESIISELFSGRQHESSDDARPFRSLRSAYIPNPYRTTDHCAETLREVLMCNLVVSLIMFHWVNGLDEPYPDYNTFHQCRDYDAVLNWALDNSVRLEFPVTRKSEDYAMKEPPF